MAGKPKAMPARSFRDALGGEFVEQVKAAADEKEWRKWDTRGQMLNIIGESTATLQTWLTARLEELIRERVSLDQVKVVCDGARTTIYARGQPRFEFKIKCSMQTV